MHFSAQIAVLKNRLLYKCFYKNMYLPFLLSTIPYFHSTFKDFAVHDTIPFSSAKYLPIPYLPSHLSPQSSIISTFTCLRYSSSYNSHMGFSKIPLYANLIYTLIFQQILSDFFHILIYNSFNRYLDLYW